MKRLSILFLFALSLYSCTTSEKKIPVIAERDTTITKEISYSELFLDSVSIAQFEQPADAPDSLHDQIQNFYNLRNYQFAWFFPDGAGEFVNTFLSLQNDYIHYSGDSTLYNPVLTARIDSLHGLKVIDPKDPIIIETELSLTQQFFRYANKAYSGNQKINARELNWFIPRKKIDTRAFLDSLLKNKGENLATYEPVNRQYRLLREKVLKFHQIHNTLDTNSITFTKKLKKGDSAESIKLVKKKLFQLGDMQVNDSTSLFDSTLSAAVINFQNRMGLTADGTIGPNFIKELNVPISERIKQILINMERIRWMPATPSSDYILVNIPEFQMHVYEKGELAFNMIVVVGSEAHNTVIFSGSLNQIVFSPYWNIPPGILKNEILPGIRRNPNYLARHNMERYSGGIRQKPGKSNSLGLVKFLFPNSYNIYFHDTPSKGLFASTSRAFSHGCIRLNEPVKLAEFLLRKDSTWTSEKIKKAMSSGKEKYVRLKGKNEIPVFIGYFTAWVDRNGQLQFRKDVYGHDRKMADHLFANN